MTEQGKKKTVELPTGIFGWRTTPPSVSLKNVKKVMEELKKLGLTQFIRIKEEINKEAILREPDVAKHVKGILITQHEEFVVKPVEVQVEIISDVKKFRKKEVNK